MEIYDPKKEVWLNPNIEYLFNREIIEYDMTDAGYSLIKEFKLLPDSEIRRLGGLDKGFERHKAVGILQRDNREFAQALSRKFAEMRMIFLRTNNISDDDIIAVRKDAIFTVGHQRRLRFGYVQFVDKNHYTSYIRLVDSKPVLELFYSSEGVDVKGMGDSINRHRLYMLEFLKTMIGMIECQNPRVRTRLMSFIDQYKSGQLSEEYYLEFNNMSKAINPLYNFQQLLVPLVQIVQKEIKV